jgi:cation transport ATPase
MKKMKQKLLYLVVVLSVFSILTGCIATHVGNMSGSASLNSPNFMYKKQNIFGEATATYVLGIGGEAKQSLLLDAKTRMMKENPLLKNQALANVAVSYKTTYFIGFLVIVVKCNVSADIVEFGPVQTDFSQSQLLNSKPEISKDNSSTVGITTDNKPVEIINIPPIKIGDKVKIINYFSNPVDGKVLDIQNGDYTVEYTNANKKIKRVKVLGFQVQKID